MVFAWMHPFFFIFFVSLPANKSSSLNASTLESFQDCRDRTDRWILHASLAFSCSQNKTRTRFECFHAPRWYSCSYVHPLSSRLRYTMINTPLDINTIIRFDRIQLQLWKWSFEKKRIDESGKHASLVGNSYSRFNTSNWEQCIVHRIVRKTRYILYLSKIESSKVTYDLYGVYLFRLRITATELPDTLSCEKYASGSERSSISDLCVMW